MPTIFSRIAAGEIPSYKVAEDDRFYAFLDINPIQPGHVLVIPRAEVDYIFDLDDETLSGLHLFAKRVAEAQKTALPCRRIAMAVVGMEVPHAHIHLVPISKESDLDFRHKCELSEAEMKEIANKIASSFK